MKKEMIYKVGNNYNGLIDIKKSIMIVWLSIYIKKRHSIDSEIKIKLTINLN